ncbi:hypothetical protein [Persicobacter sp. CCB-QB2]|nr:hypothetical protein [Persicobacter sp. CCB-QB2]
METSYLDYAKEVLSKLTFDPLLFEKEKIKMQAWLSPQERQALQEWLSD